METPFYSAEPSILTAELPNEDRIIRTTRREIQEDSKFAKMPSDVLLPIIDGLDMAGKAYLLATCQYLRHLVEPLLYRSLSPDDTWRSCRRVRLLKTLGKRQDLLPLIHSFRGFLIPTSISGPEQPTEEFPKYDMFPKEEFQDEWLAIAVPLFIQAINIRNLDIKGYSAWGQNGRWELYKSVVYGMKLNGLALDCSSLGPLDFAPILRGQPGLTRLELDCPTAQFDGLEKEDVPRLTSFKGTLRQAEIIVPGRPVTKLGVTCVWLDECQCVSEHVYQTLALSSDTIKEFTLVPHQGPNNDTFRPMLQLIRQYLPKIVDLAIIPRYTVSGEVLLDEIPKFSSIIHLTLSEAWLELPDSITGGPNADPGAFDDGSDWWERFSERLKELCPSLTDFEYTPLRLPMCGNAAFLERLKRRDYL
ncbi:hypothetical protein M407DRAFT_113216 [Tulasnella calospora MUT 4182]|uniref:F-box domain-containing protein n=1 Tax=Tulasnella calospora MUT 4182 TaxID=1051891 RepID=A0A0C3Q3A1_9AGAM|nr:hypothetical protein M407DRAFT_113216 [Tulasnella calospora MUT 4182]